VTTSTPVPRLDELLDQERRLKLPSLDYNDALAIGLRLCNKANERNLPVTIEVRKGNRVVFRAAREGTNAQNDMYVEGKVRVVERFGHSSLYERLRHEHAGTTFAEATALSFPEYAPFGGGFPLSVAGTGPVGVAVVSGLAQEDDHALIVECLEDYLATNSGQPGE
jgi:uncharacterized protein (UPF0303 family)